MTDCALFARKITLLCLVPDSGHVIPLLRLGRLLHGAGATVTLICSEEAAHLAEGQEVDVLTFALVRPVGYQQVLARITDSTEVTRRIWLNRWFEERYAEPIQEAVLRQLDPILELVCSTQPALLVADDHLFRGVALWLARQCDCPLVLNYSAGTNYRFIRRKPWQNRTQTQERAITWAARVVPKLARAKERLLTPEHGRARQRRLRFLEEQWSRLATPRELLRDVPHIAAGLIALENRYLSDKVTLLQQLIAFPSTPPLQGEALAPALNQWLRAGGPVVYFCFGTMAPRQLRFGRRLVDACLASGFRVLWASPSPPVKLSRYDDAKVRWEQWLPQVTLLARPEIAGFVTHAGGGSVQEALWFDKPLICIPLTWDQPYNAWVAEQLGFGVKLDKQMISKARLRVAFEMLATGDLIKVASRLGADMRKSSGEREVVSFLSSCLSQPGLIGSGGKNEPAQLSAQQL